MGAEVIIIGASGHGHVVADIVKASNNKVIGFLDDNVELDTLGTISDYKKFPNAEFIISNGDSLIRKKIADRLKVKWHTAIHPSAVISPSAHLQEGTVVMANAVVNARAKVGKHCIINSSAVIEHDNQIGDFCHISVGGKVGGSVSIEEHVWVGIGAVISNNIHICSGCIIGAGAVVVKDIRENGTYIGVPAKLSKGVK